MPASSEDVQEAVTAEMVCETIIDPTLTVWEPLLTFDASAVSPDYADFVDIAPPAVARS